MMKTPRNVRVEASMRIMQGWFGECDLKYKPQVHSLFFRKEELDGVLTLHMEFDIIDEKGNEIRVTMPVDNFNYMMYTDRDFAYEMPVTMIFNLDAPGYKELERSIPGLYQEWKTYYAEKGKEFTNSLMFVLDPSELLFTEDDNILYRPGYVEGIDMFRETFKEPWSDHLRENIEREETDSDGHIVMISSEDFVKYYESFSLRNVESSVHSDNKRKTMRVFYLHVKKETRASKRAAKKRGAMALAAEAAKRKQLEEDSKKIQEKAATRVPDFDVEKEEITLIEREMKRQMGENTDSDFSEEIDERFDEDLSEKQDEDGNSSIEEGKTETDESGSKEEDQKDASDKKEKKTPIKKRTQNSRK